LAVFATVQQQVPELSARLHQVDARQPGALLAKAGNAEQLAQDDPRVVEAQGLVEVACQQVSFHRSAPQGRFIGGNSTPPTGQLRRGALARDRATQRAGSLRDSCSGNYG